MLDFNTYFAFIVNNTVFVLILQKAQHLDTDLKEKIYK